MSMVIQVEPELERQAELVFEQLGTSISDVMNVFLRYVVARKKLPNDLNSPPVPCINDMTDDEIDSFIQEGMNDIDSGLVISAEAVEQEMYERYGRYV